MDRAISSKSVQRDERRLAYAEYGKPDGVPVLFIPGAGCGRLTTFGADGVLVECGIRLISVDRPGLGASTPDPHKTLHSVANDIAALIDTLVGNPVAVVANSQGAPFGLALATTGRARELVLVSPIDDVAYPPITAMLATDYRTLVAHVAADPDAALQTLSTYTAESLFDMLMTAYPPSDATIYEDAQFRASLRAALTDGFTCGPGGYARDTVLAMSAWPTQLFCPDVAVTVLFGADDRVHSPDLGATLTHRIAGARRDIITGVGGSLLWAHPHVVLAAARTTGTPWS